MAVILLAEDSPTHTALMRSLLTEASHTVHCAVNGREALQKLAEVQPEIVVTDLRMPEMNGLELVQAIAADHPELPSVVVTARGSEALAVDALALGAANFVPKNSLTTLLTHVVGRTIRMAKADGIYSQFAGRLHKPEFAFTLSNHLSAIEPATLFVLQSLAAAGRMNATHRIRVGTAIASAIFNAICYGNLNIKDEDTAVGRMVVGQESGESELEHLADIEPYCSLAVELKVSVGNDDTRILVSHEGPGRMTRMTPAPGTPESFELEQCRGLMLMTSFMDDVIFHNDYSEVVMIKNHPESPAG
jgi:CheY-like chemotaxis protein